MNSTATVAAPAASAPAPFKEVWLISLGHSLTHWYPATFLLLLPIIGKELGLSYAEMGFIITVQNAVGAITNIPGGMLVDAVGYKGRLMAISLFWIGVPYWRRGYATEALRGILRHAFDDRGLLYVTTGIPAGNPAAERVLRKVGLKFESFVEGGFRRDGFIQDRVNHGLFADEWRALHC